MNGLVLRAQNVRALALRAKRSSGPVRANLPSARSIASTSVAKTLVMEFRRETLSRQEAVCRLPGFTLAEDEHAMAAHNRQEHAWAAGIDEHDYSGEIGGRGENWPGDVRAFGSAKRGSRQ